MHTANRARQSADRLVLVTLVATLLPLFSGCHFFHNSPSEGLDSFLQPVRSSPDSVALEIYQVRVHPSQFGLLHAAWQSSDETRIDSEARSRLADNGFRVGVMSKTILPELSSLLQLQQVSVERAEGQQITQETADPQVNRQMVRLERHEQSKIVVSSVRDEAVVLLNDNGSTSGATFETVEAIYTLRGEVKLGQLVSVDLTPELHYGQVQHRFTGEHGMLVLTPSRDRRVFDDLTITAKLEPGELIVIGAIKNARSSLGHAFHQTESNGATMSRIVVIRAAEVPPSELFSTN